MMQVAAFPESSILGWENPAAHRLAEPIPGADTRRIQDLAKKFDLMIAIGLDSGASVAVSATGEVIAKLRDRDAEVKVVEIHPRGRGV